MTKREILNEVVARVCFIKDKADLHSHTSISHEEAAIDSMGEVELVYEIDDLFGILLSFDELRDCKTYGELIDKLNFKGAEL